MPLTSRFTRGKAFFKKLTATDITCDTVTATTITAAITASAGSISPTEEGLSVINKTGLSIGTDKVVAIVGLDATSGKPKIVLADADVAAYDELYVTTAAIADSATGTVSKGALSAANLNTNSASAAGDPVYLSTTAGAFTHTAPTGTTARVHAVGFVVVKSATVGQIQWQINDTVRTIGTNEIQAAAVTAAKVTLTDAHLLVGNGSNVAADVAVSGDVTLANTGAVTIGAAKVLKTMLAGSFSKVTVADGVNETSAHAITVSGMAAGDEIVAVLVLTTKANIATMAAHAGTFTAGSGAITTISSEVDNTNNQYIIFWTDLT